MKCNVIVRLESFYKSVLEHRQSSRASQAKLLEHSSVFNPDAGETDMNDKVCENGRESADVVSDFPDDMNSIHS